MMDKNSELHLLGVHPDLVKVIRAALQTPQPFIVDYGLRTFAAEEEAVRTGHSTTLHSRHLPQKRYATPQFPDGLSCAVDTVALIGGVVNFAKGREQYVFGNIAAQVKAASALLKITIQWGGDWHEFKDWGHFQLPWETYPG